jgi:hypothetical protein
MVHLAIQVVGRKSFIMISLPANGAGYDTHRAVAIVSPGGHLDLVKTGITRWEKGRVPTKQSFRGQLFFKVQRRIQQELNNAIGVLIPDGWYSCCWQTESPGNRRPHSMRVKSFPFDLGCFQSFFDEDFGSGLLPDFKPKFSHLCQ